MFRNTKNVFPGFPSKVIFQEEEGAIESEAAAEIRRAYKVSYHIPKSYQEYNTIQNVTRHRNNMLCIHTHGHGLVKDYQGQSYS